MVNLLCGIWEDIENIKMNHHEMENKKIQKSWERQNADDGGERGGDMGRNQQNKREMTIEERLASFRNERRNQH